MGRKGSAPPTTPRGVPGWECLPPACPPPDPQATACPHCCPTFTPQVGAVLGSLVASGHADLKTLGDHIRTADMEEVPEGEDTMLVDSGNAAKVGA